MSGLPDHHHQNGPSRITMRGSADWNWLVCACQPTSDGTRPVRSRTALHDSRKPAGAGLADAYACLSRLMRDSHGRAGFLLNLLRRIDDLLMKRRDAHPTLHTQKTPPPPGGVFAADPLPSVRKAAGESRIRGLCFCRSVNRFSELVGVP